MNVSTGAMKVFSIVKYTQFPKELFICNDRFSEALHSYVSVCA